MRYSDPTGHWVTSPDGKWSHPGEADFGVNDSSVIPKAQQDEYNQKYYTPDSEHDNAEILENGVAVGVYLWGFGSIRYNTNYDLSVKGWSYRLDKAHDSTTGQKHMHIEGPSGKEWAQNEDGSNHHRNQPPNDPPKSMKKEVKKKTGWDWDAKAEAYNEKQKQIDMLIQEASLYYPDGIPEDVLYAIIESVNLGRPTIPSIRIPSGARPLFVP